ncbi:YmfQ family protein [Dickeya oryzae]|uniref:YmfQ family protein n=1 Tax=Dickeya oryzae TaxID=1240404 RepID=UPI0003AA53B2|nr:putative phage tail protein [Dickeya oryzae]
MKELLSLLLPPVSYSPNAEQLSVELTAEGNALSATKARANDALGAVTPLRANGLLSDWERVLGIAPVVGLSYQQRLEDVLIKIAETGGLSIPYFKGLAKKMGYDITIDELMPFRCGVSRCGQRLASTNIRFVWRVNVGSSSVKKYYFRTGISRCGERLMSSRDAVIESVFNELKPAHTLCVFNYTYTEAK